MPEEGVLTLQELHHIIQNVWLTRFDEELAEEQAARRKGRPKSAKEQKLEEIRLREAEEYRTGMGEFSLRLVLMELVSHSPFLLSEVIDLSHAPTVEIFRRWDQTEVAFIQLLRFIRIFSTDPETFVISRPGKHLSILGAPGDDPEMEGVEESSEQSTLSSHPRVPPLTDPPSRFSSTMMTMDGPIAT